MMNDEINKVSEIGLTRAIDQHGNVITRLVRGPTTETAITDDEITALCVAIGNSVGSKTEAPLVSLLSRLAPEHPLLGVLSRLAVEHGQAEDYSP